MRKNNLSTSERVAKILLEIKAVIFSPKKPYKFVSGILSPIYTDNRLLMAHPLKRKEITIYMANLLKEKDYKPDVIAGTSTAGIPPAAWLSEMLNLPMIYVRSEKKDHGKGRLVEGILKRGDKVLLIEDLISTGKSSLSAVKAIRQEGGEIEICLAFFDYRLKESQTAYRKNNVNLFTLTNLEILLSLACDMKIITQKEKTIVLRWQEDPWNWSKKEELKEQGHTVDY